jgi:FkbM family methyltransferase
MVRTYSTENAQPKLVNLDLECDLVNAQAGNLYVIKNDLTVSENIRTLGHWAWDHVEIFKALNRKRGGFVDVGSYLGHHSVAILNWLSGDGEVLAIEGQPQIAELCSLNLNIQEFSNWTVFESMADEISSSYQIPIEDFSIPNNFGALSLISPQEEFGKNFFEVKSSRIDDMLLDVDDIQIMKFDVQYAELFALKGCSKILQKHKPNLFVEIAPQYMLTKGGYDYRSIYNFLTGFGYRLFDVLGKPVEFGRSADPVLYKADLEWDVIAIHESKIETLKFIPWLY